MEAESIQTYAKLEKYYWWFVGRRKVIETILQKYFKDRQDLVILDWGCGPGGNYGFLSQYGEVFGVDASEEALRFANEQGYQNLVKAETLKEFNPPGKFDLVTNFDVLEHIREDERFLQDLRQVLVPGGYVLVTVPAFQFLWSNLDQILGHVRRYSRAKLVQKFERNGYQVIMASYFVFFLALPFILYRAFQELTGRNRTLAETAPELPPFLNSFLAKLMYLDARLIKHLNLPFGTSLILLARKTNERGLPR